jgi:mlo protein
VLQIRAWKEWEKEAAGKDYEFSNGISACPFRLLIKANASIDLSVLSLNKPAAADPTRFRFTHETSFVRQHMNVLNKTPASFYIVRLQ